MNIELNKKETVEVMETILFTNTTEEKIKSKSPLAYYDLLDILAFENKLKARFTKQYMFGCIFDIKKAQDLLIKSVKEN